MDWDRLGEPLILTMIISKNYQRGKDSNQAADFLVLVLKQL